MNLVTCTESKLQLSRQSLYSLFVAIAFALLADVVSEHGAQNEIFFRSEMV